MKKILILIVSMLGVIFSSTIGNLAFWAPWPTWNNPTLEYCVNNDCWLENWVDGVKDWIEWVEKNNTFGDFIQQFLEYLLGFVYFIALVVIIYSWYILLLSVWDEDAMWKAKNNIVYALVWIAVMYLANSIVKFMVDALQAWAG